MTTIPVNESLSTIPKSRVKPFREVSVALSLFILWQYLVWLKGRHTPIGAISRGRFIYHVERILHINIEPALQHLAKPIWNVANVYYDVAHVGCMVALIVCLGISARQHWHFFRNTLFLCTFGGLLFQFLLSSAPPRFIGIPHLLDTANISGLSIYAAAGNHVDQFSTFPSLHVAWAAIVAAVALKCFRSPFRYLGCVHLFATSLAVMITGNHFLLDCISGALLAFGAAWIAGKITART